MSVQKTVEIALQITGAKATDLSGIISAFEKLDIAVKNIQTTLNSFQRTLSEIKAPPGLKDISASFKELNNVKVPNLTAFAFGLKEISGVKLPTIGNFVNSLQKLSGIQLPSIKTFAVGLTELSGIKIPLIGTFVSNLQKLSGVRPPNLTVFTNGLKKLVDLNVNAVVSQISQLNIALASLEKRGGLSSFAKFASDLNTLKSALNGAQSSVQKMGENLNQLNQNLTKSANTTKGFVQKLQTVLTFRAISEAIIAVTNAVTGGIDAIIEYDQALKNLQAITGATDLAVYQMGQKIIEVATLTKFSASEVAAGMVTLGQAGFSASESVQAMAAVADLATATLSTMEESVQLMSTTLRVFQIDASQSAAVADVFANAINKSKLTIDKMKTAMNYVGPVAHDVGLSFKELSAAMMVLGNSGIRASTMGTGLRQVLSALVEPSDKFKAAAKQAGVTLSDLDPTITDFSTVISNLSLVLGDTGTAFELFGKRGASSALALVAQGGASFSQMLDLTHRTGTAAEMAAKQMEGLAVSFKNLRDRLGVLAIAMGKGGITTVMRSIIDVSVFLIEILTKLANSTIGNLVLKITAATGVIASFIAVFNFGKLLLTTTAIGKLIVSTGGLTKATLLAAQAGVALQAAYWPIVVVVAAIGAVAYQTYKILKDDSRKAADQATLLGDEYTTLAKKIKDYEIAVSTLKAGSDELKEANLQLRKELLEVALGTSKVADQARAAYESINPLTGAFDGGTEAFKTYNDSLAELKLSSFKTAVEESAKSLDFQTSAFKRWQYGLTEVAKTFLTLVKRDVDVLAAILNRDFEQIPKIWLNRMKEIVGQLNGAAESFSFAESLNKATDDFQKLQDEIAGWDSSKYTEQQKAIIESNNILIEKSKQAVQNLRDMGKISLEHTIQDFEMIADKNGYANIELQAMTYEFGKLKIAADKTFRDIIDGWAKSGDTRFLTKNLDEYVTKLRQIGGEVYENQVQELRGFEDVRVKRVAGYKEWEERVEQLRKKQNASEEEWMALEKEHMELKRGAYAENDKLVDNALAQQLLSFNETKIKFDKLFAESRETFKDNAELMAKDYYRILMEYEDAVEKLQQETIKILADQSEDIGKEFEANLKGIKTEFSVVEKAASQSWKNIGTSANVSLDEQLNGVNDFVSFANNSFDDHSKNLINTFTELKGKYFQALSTKDGIEEQKKIQKVMEEVTQAGAKFYAEMAEKIEGAIDDIAAREAKLLDNLVKYADEKIKLEEKFADLRTDLDQRHMEHLEKYNDNIKKAEEYKLKGIQKAAEAEQLSGEAKIKALDDAQKLFDKSLTYVEKLTSNEADLTAQKRANNEIEKANEKNAEAALETGEKREKLLKEENEHRLKAAEYMKKYEESVANSVSQERERSDVLRLSGELEAQSLKLIKSKEESTKNELEDLKSSLDILNEFKAEYDKIAAAVAKPIKFSLDPDEAKKQLNEFEANLRTQLGSGYEVKLKFEDKVNTAPITEEIVKIDGVWTNVWNSVEKKAKSSVETVQKLFKVFSEPYKTTIEIEASKKTEETIKKLEELQKKEEIPINMSFTGTGSPKLPISEKINYIKAELAELSTTEIPPINLVLKTDEIKETGTLISNLQSFLDKLKDAIEIHISIPGFDYVYNSVKKLVDKLAELVDKEITITTNYETKGSAPEGRRWGGRIPGFGGGDKHPILAEGGEWFINKEAVQKYGDSFFAALNSMSLPKFREGGKVGNIINNIQVGKNNTKTDLNDFGKVTIDTGNVKFPAIVQKDVVTELQRYLQKSVLMGVNG